MAALITIINMQTVRFLIIALLQALILNHSGFIILHEELYTDGNSFILERILYKYTNFIGGIFLWDITSM